MSIINNGLLLASGADAATTYQISRSIRLNAPDSAYFSRTPSSAGNRKTFTWSAWVKRSDLSDNEQVLFSAQSGTTSWRDLIEFANGKLIFTCTNSSNVITLNLQTTAVYRDPGAWMHIVIAVDTTQSTAANRARIYVNGSEVTVFSLANYPSQNTDLSFNDTRPHTIGQAASGTGWNFSGYLADIYYLDGTATDPSTFAQTDAVTGQWVPKTPTGISYGTNGFRLTFSDNSGTTSTTLGKDGAGSNNWSPNNFSVASGSGNDSLVDSPTSFGTDTGAGGEVRGNYCTWNPLANSATLTNGNLDCANSAASWQTALSTIAVSSGKWFAELTLTTHSVTNAGIHFGIAATSYSPAAGNYLGNTSTSYAYRSVVGEATGSKVNSNSFTSYGAVSTQGDVVGLALDLDAGTLTFYKNGVSQGQAFSGISGTFVIALSVYNAAGSINFGARSFAYTAPSGFKALCDTHLTAPTIALPSTVMDVVLYTGTGSSLTPTSTLGFNPDLIWIKSRSAGTDNALYDAVRGAQARLESNNTDTEVTSDNGVTAFNSAGFTVGTLAQVNTSSATYVAWCWDAGSSTVTNTQGSINTSLRASPSSGFSVATWSGTGSGSVTVGHGLGVAPRFMIIKDRSLSRNWLVYHTSLGASSGLALNSTTVASGTDGGWWNHTAPTSTVATIGTYGNEASNYVGYFWAPVAGYSAMGSYISTGTTDNVFNFCNFRPRFLLIKNASVNNNWFILDSARSTFNAADDGLGPSSSSAEDPNNSGYSVDFLSNGFKVRSNNGIVGNSGDTVVWAAFAESPFQYARAR